VRKAAAFLLVGLSATLNAAEVVHLRQDQRCPLDQVGTWLRLDDQVAMHVSAEDDLHELAVGAYHGPRGIITLREKSGIGDWGLALVGLPSAHRENPAQREREAIELSSMDPFALPIWIWRKVDGYDWPWVGHGLTGGGLLGLCDERVHEATWMPTAGSYVDHDQPITLGDEGTIALGDLIVARPIYAVLVADLGIIGKFDPADEVVVSLPDADGRVRRLPLGELVGRGGFTVWRRNSEHIIASEGPHVRATHISEKAEELAKLPLHRQWMAAGGMAIVCLTLLRLIWKRRRADQNR
jgi:hypothetical protein